jgi:glutathione S-transferase
MKFYDLPWGPFPRRVTIYMQEKGIEDIEIVPIDYATGENRAPWMLEKNPLGSLPVLELDSGRCITDSYAIMEYLEELYPEPSFSGRTGEERARMRMMLNHIADVNLRAGPVYVNILPQWSRAVKQDPAVAEWTRPGFMRSLECIEHLADETGPFLMGDRITLADCAMYPLPHHNVANYDDYFITPDFPKLKRWFEMFSQRDSAPCILRDDGLREEDAASLDPDKAYWWRQSSEPAGWGAWGSKKKPDQA